MRRFLALVLIVVACASFAGADPLPESPYTQDPLGPLFDATDVWQNYQPAAVFCVKPDVFQLTDIGPTVTGADPDCADSGYPITATGLVKIKVETPPLCAGCRRLFFDYASIPAENDPPRLYAHGHAYVHLTSFNPSYTVEPIAHSPNIKNFTNDKLFVPDGSMQEPYVWAFDLHAIAYTANTAHIVHSDVQGPYFAGPWYINVNGDRVYGAFLDVNVVTDLGPLPGDHRLNEIGYGAGFHSGETICPDEVVGDGMYADGDAYYGGCVDGFGGSRGVIDPYA